MEMVKCTPPQRANYQNLFDAVRKMEEVAELSESSTLCNQ